jgi:hypothetical protein
MTNPAVATASRRRWLKGLAVAAVSPAALAEPPLGDARIVADAEPVAAGPRVALFQHGLTVDPAFLTLAEKAAEDLALKLGRPLDVLRMGPKINIYVSTAVGVSHVWKGYEHPSDPRAILFLNPRVVAGALNGSNATYVHEMTHLYAWRFASHTLREGLADHMALQWLPGAGVGPNAEGLAEAATGAVPAEMRELLGTTQPPPPWLRSDPARRRAYYAASYRFVKALVERQGLAVFMQLYDAPDPEAAMLRLYGSPREALVRAAGL